MRDLTEAETTLLSDITEQTDQMKEAVEEALKTRPDWLNPSEIIAAAEAWVDFVVDYKRTSWEEWVTFFEKAGELRPEQFGEFLARDAESIIREFNGKFNETMQDAESWLSGWIARVGYGIKIGEQ